MCPDNVSNNEERFHIAMLNLYRQATELTPPYHAIRFLQMIQKTGGKKTADALLASANSSTGFTELFLRGRDCLKLTVEYLVLQEPWNSLFTDEQLSVARKRLLDVGVTPPNA